ncbi:MAG: hypothetical protein ACK4N5_24620, partial [Myxococcales bacterium]
MGFSFSSWFRGRLTALATPIDDTNDPDFVDFTTSATINPSEPFVAAQYHTSTSGWVATQFTLMQQQSQTTWRKVTTAGDIRGLSFADPQNGIVVGGNSYVFVVSTAHPNGTSPTTPPAAGKQLNAVHLVPGLKYGVAVGNGGYVAETFDAGLTWRTVPSGTAQNLLAVHCFDANTCTAVGSGGTALAFVNEAPNVTGALTPAGTGEGQQAFCASAPVSDAEGDAIAVSGTLPPPLVNGSWSVAAGTLRACFDTPSRICADTPLTLRATLSDGRRTRSVDLPFTVEDRVADPPENVTAAESPPTGFAWQPGGVYTVTAGATLPCGGTPAWDFTVAGGLPSPTKNGDKATFEAPPT